MQIYDTLSLLKTLDLQSMEVEKKDTGDFASVSDEALMTAFPANGSLTIFCGAKEISWSILDKDKNKYLQLRSYHFAHNNEIEEVIPYLNNILERESVFTNKFRNVTIVVDTALYTLVPDTLYESFRREDYLSFNHEIPKGDIIDGYSLRTRGMVVLFSYPANLRQIITRKFPSARIIPSVAGLVESAFTLFKNKEGRSILVNIRQQSFDVLVMEPNRLTLLNTFPYKSSEDFLYYLLFTCEQLGLNTESMQLNVAGEIEKRSGLMKLMEKYIRNISYVKRPASFEYSYKFKDLPEHYFFNILSQQLCV
jgi:hypothetical protein